ncbi:aminotransferase class I/II-fold pyridoxal phosphate-dependent enzyme [Sulfurimonas paralvinellae]|uniref:Aminotransferase class I/II-fold pyridoxal phosphate-dependent enzyme n=1 Tax=Sulfurimonas paralvinellae TaxID=317658 RepID=A0A7M1B9J6_9BACT|nr:aminotransferase class I/II-fold pyridoxal phosphate-dependent enzyme [Sulfurimonas paralvinellae]QOP46407.1 aminotransferase class I/II-fold pyridoxal phosphate-dependent enzyme [Sulfurimonas paralvinellae]
MFYKKELEALKRAGRYRTREIVSNELHDFASNDYLGLAHNKTLHQKTCDQLGETEIHASKASMLVNGYHQIHKEFEDALCKANGFEAGIVLGSGFNANIALIESLVRKGDKLFMDELYHASGVLASQLHGIDVMFFPHNDMNVLREMLKTSQAKRNIVAVEGIYSMDGDLCSREVFAVCNENEAILIVDEAHSSGVVGETLMGVYEHYGIDIAPNHIKMGTLGKAYGSFGAFILASEHIVSYLLNRAKPIIYATSLSLYDTLLAHNSLAFILAHADMLREEIEQRKSIVKQELGIQMDGLIAAVPVGDNRKVITIKDALLEKGYAIGGIRQPTVPSAIVRLIARLGESRAELQNVCQELVGLL